MTLSVATRDLLLRARRFARWHLKAPLSVPFHWHHVRTLRSAAWKRLDEIALEAQRNGRRPLILLGLHYPFGDLVVASAAIRAVRRRDPNATVVFAAPRRSHNLLVHNPNLDHVIDCDCVGSLTSVAAHPALDRVHLLLVPEDHCRLCGAVYTDKSTRLVAEGIRYHGWFQHGRHLTDLMLEQVDAVGADPTPELFVPDDIRARMRERLRALVPERPPLLVAMHTRTPHWPAKQWPFERFNALMVRLVDELGARVIVIGAEPAPGLPPCVIDLTTRTTLLDMAALLAEVDLFIGLDSGPSHMAAAVGASCILLFGPTYPAVCRPRSAKVHVLWPGNDEDGPFAMELRPGARFNRDMEKIAVDDVVGLVRTTVARRVSGEPTAA